MIDLERTRIVSSLKPLDDTEEANAEFRAQDRAWAELVALFEARKEVDAKLSYQSIADRIGRSRKQVQRWFSSSFNMTMKSFGLLAEALDADLEIRLQPRQATNQSRNYAHPSDVAKGRIEIDLATVNKVYPLTCGNQSKHSVNTFNMIFEEVR